MFRLPTCSQYQTPAEHEMLTVNICHQECPERGFSQGKGIRRW